MNCPKCGRRVVLENKDGKSFIKAHRVGPKLDPKLGCQARKRTPCPASGDEVAVPAEAPSETVATT